jgi:ectoine hydroxylase-related dioxygenase (phytanoyl-CoA dioxygenase family)
MLQYIIFLFLCYIIIYSFINNDKILDTNKSYNIKNDGFSIYKNVFNTDEINKLLNHINNKEYKKCKEYLIKHPKLNSIIRKNLDNKYVFQDYIWIIIKSLVHTCHRDNNGTFFNKNQKYPSYTMLIYLEDMEKCLGVIPESHKDKYSYGININDQVKNIICNKGDIILFDANLIHVGALNHNKEDNIRIQMKVSHSDDLQSLYYYQNFNKILNNTNNVPFELKKMQKNISCLFPIVSDLTQKETVKAVKGTEEGSNLSFLQKIYSYLFYGNSNFYDLKNI